MRRRLRDRRVGDIAGRPLRLLVLLALATWMSGCTPVPAWQRGRLAHPTMKPGSAVGVAEGHVHEVQEGAIGGSDGEGSGCGCN